MGKDKESEAELSINNLLSIAFAHQDVNQSHMFLSLIASKIKLAKRKTIKYGRTFGFVHAQFVE